MKDLDPKVSWRRYTRIRCACFGIVASLFLYDVAHATESEPKRAAMQGPESKATLTRTNFIVLDGWAGGGFQQGNTQGPGIVALGGTALFRTSWLTVGVGGEVGGVFLDAFHEYLSVLGGATWDFLPWFRVDTLGAAGLHFEQPNSGLDIFGERRVVGGDESIEMPYLGARVSPTFVFWPKRRCRMLLGALFEVKQDIGSREPHYTVETCSEGWFDGEYSCSKHEYSYRTGGFHFTVGVRIAVEIGLDG